MVVIVSAVMVIGVKESCFMNKIFTLINLAATLCIVVFGLPSINFDFWNIKSPHVRMDSPEPVLYLRFDFNGYCLFSTWQTGQMRRPMSRTHVRSQDALEKEAFYLLASKAS